jgi:NAD(P)-dependent dehydrogenase (short-subunit alcohol dehydrogenase family)
MAHLKGKLNFEDIMHDNCPQPEKQMMGLISGYYCNSKLANSLFNIELSKRLKKYGINTYALCPGFVATEIGKEFETGIITYLKKIYLPFTKTAEEVNTK